MRVEEQYDGVRLDIFIFDQYSSEEHISRGMVQSSIEAGLVKVDKKPCTKPALRLKKGQEVLFSILTIAKKEDVLPVAENIPLEILFEDNDVLIINKPSGMPTHPDEHYNRGTVVNAVLGYLKTHSLGGEISRPGIVHRLDKDTSGVLMIAKNPKAHAYLSAIIADRKITKKYTALVMGAIPVSKGTIDAPLTRDPNNRERMITMENAKSKSALTHFDVLEHYTHPTTTLISVHIITGRTHQIRAHCKSIGFSVAGDRLYGSDTVNDEMKKNIGLQRMFLHATSLCFVLPSGEELEINAPIPADLENVLTLLRKEKPL